MRLEKDEWGKRGRSGEEEDGLKSEREEERRGGGEEGTGGDETDDGPLVAGGDGGRRWRARSEARAVVAGWRVTSGWRSNTILGEDSRWRCERRGEGSEGVEQPEQEEKDVGESEREKTRAGGKERRLCSACGRFRFERITSSVGMRP